MKLSIGVLIAITLVVSGLVYYTTKSDNALSVALLTAGVFFPLAWAVSKIGHFMSLAIQEIINHFRKNKGDK